MNKALRYLLTRFANLLHKTIIELDRNPKQDTPLSLWFKDAGDHIHRLNYDLNEQSIVFDMGGYEGQWASDLFAKYCCYIYIFEAYPLYAKNIEQRFKFNSKIKTYDYGLSNTTTTTQLNVDDNASSTFKPGTETVDIQLIRAEDFFAENQIDQVDLIKINIEGGEYDLLEHLIETDLIHKIKNIQVQFHNFIPNAESRMHEIQKKLQLTHTLTYQYTFVWENWKLIE